MLVELLRDGVGDSLLESPSETSGSPELTAALSWHNALGAKAQKTYVIARIETRELIEYTNLKTGESP